MRLNLKPLYIYNDELHKYSILIPSVSKIVNILSPKDFLQIDDNILKLAQNRGICIHNMIDVWIKNNFDDELIEFIDCEIKSHRELFKNFIKLYQEIFKDIKFRHYETEKTLYSPLMCGTTDFIGITTNNEYVICDWKITSSNEKTDIELYIWLLKLYYLLEKKFCIDNKKILMIIINPKLKIVIKEKVNITKQDLEQIKEAILIWQEREEWENATRN
ncbi:hypothetical protein M0C40_09245 [Spiroplasma citri]|uniref:PD-(D/E)XK endonuclease-like domain-containing protein n=1 Tax=Spiroplasma citri TaxID=2133 RepID=A0AAX3SYK0_SPICI|nr:hypothetical protein [Spiroplasma citri]WFG96247.1 hypothetical protein M0C40_09245 [Spiroplasma citri]